MTIKFMYNGIKVDGKLIKGHWSRQEHQVTTSGHVLEEKIAFYASSCLDSLPADIFDVKNTTDITTDYVEEDRTNFYTNSAFYQEAYKAWHQMKVRNTEKHIKSLTRCIEKSVGYRKEQLEGQLEEAVQTLESLAA